MMKLHFSNKRLRRGSIGLNWAGRSMNSPMIQISLYDSDYPDRVTKHLWH